MRACRIRNFVIVLLLLGGDSMSLADELLADLEEVGDEVDEEEQTQVSTILFPASVIS